MVEKLSEKRADKTKSSRLNGNVSKSMTRLILTINDCCFFCISKLCGNSNCSTKKRTRHIGHLTTDRFFSQKASEFVNLVKLTNTKY